MQDVQHHRVLVLAVHCQHAHLLQHLEAVGGLGILLGVHVFLEGETILLGGVGLLDYSLGHLGEVLLEAVVDDEPAAFLRHCTEAVEGGVAYQQRYSLLGDDECR